MKSSHAIIGLPILTTKSLQPVDELVDAHAGELSGEGHNSRAGITFSLNIGLSFAFLIFDLGNRMRRAAPPYPVLFLGSDAPDLAPEHLHSAADLLERHDVVIGPADDGGYWTIGLAGPFDALFDAMPWGTDRVLSETMSRLDRLGIVPALLPLLADCDRPDDLARWPRLVP